MKRLKLTARLGRPRSFDADRALDRALEVFWREGYEGASLSDLSKAMGLNRPSIYAAFGDKESLFRKALDRYVSGPAAYVLAALSERPARAAMERLLNGAAEGLTDPHHPQGCLLVQGALSCSREFAAIQQELSVRREAVAAALRKRLSRAKLEGDLAADSNPADLARYFAAVLHGMAVQAAGGASRNDLKRVVRTAMRAWPGHGPNG
jgi:AcrR family transcriptional regulator